MAYISRAFFAVLALTSTFAVAGTLSSTQLQLPSYSESRMLAPEKPKKDALKNLYLDYANVYHGPTLDKASPYSVNYKGELDPDALAGFDQEAYFGFVYDQDSTSVVGVDVQWSNDIRDPQHAFDMGDIGLRWLKLKTIATDSFLLSTDAYLQLPTSDAAKQHDMNFAFESTPFFIWDIPETRWRIGTWGDVRYRNGVKDGYVSKVYASPYAAYKVTPKFWLNFQYETGARSYPNKGALEFRNYLSDFKPGLVFKLAPAVKLNPYVQIFPSNPVTSDRVAVGVLFYAQIL